MSQTAKKKPKPSIKTSAMGGFSLMYGETDITDTKTEPTSSKDIESAAQKKKQPVTDESADSNIMVSKDDTPKSNTKAEADSGDKASRNETLPTEPLKNDSEGVSAESGIDKADGSKASEKATEALEGYDLSHYVRILKVSAEDRKKDFSRMNYTVRDDLHQYLTTLSERTRISTSVLVEYILEDYLLEDRVQMIKPNILEYFKAVKFDESGLFEKKKRQLQLNLPTVYIEMVQNTLNAINSELNTTIDKGSFVDILIHAAMVDGR